MTKSKLARIGSGAAPRTVNYAGAAKPLKLVSFAGNGTVASEQSAANKKKFSLTIENVSADDLNVLLFRPAGGATSDGLTGFYDYAAVEGTIQDETPADVLNITSTRSSFDLLLQYLQFNPTAILRWRISAKTIADGENNELQLQQTISRKIYNPFTAQEFLNNEINLNDHFHRNQFQGGFIDVYDGFVVDGNSFTVMPILAGTRVKIDLFFGPTYNAPKALENFVDENGIMVRKTAI